MKKLLTTVTVVIAIMMVFFSVSTSSSTISPKQKFANALAYAIEYEGNLQQKEFHLSHFSCKPVGNVKVYLEQVFLCYGWATNIRTGYTRKGYTFFLADGTPIPKGEVDTAIHQKTNR